MRDCQKNPVAFQRSWRETNLVHPIAKGLPYSIRLPCSPIGRKLHTCCGPLGAPHLEYLFCQQVEAGWTGMMNNGNMIAEKTTVSGRQRSQSFKLSSAFGRNMRTDSCWDCSPKGWGRTQIELCRTSAKCALVPLAHRIRCCLIFNTHC